MTTSPPPGWWKSFYAQPELVAATALEDPRRTARQVRLLTGLLRAAGATRVLDACCGWGRLAVPLALEGFAVTGTDLSALYLERAAQAAAAAGVVLGLERCDVREMPYEGEFDAALSMSTSVGFFRDESQDRRGLARLGRAVVPPRAGRRGGLVVVDTVSVAGSRRAAARGGCRFDEQRSRLEKVVAVGAGRRDGFSYRIYRRHEMATLLDGAGLAVERWLGDYDGAAWHDGSPRLIAVARRLGPP